VFAFSPASYNRKETPFQLSPGEVQMTSVNKGGG